MCIECAHTRTHVSKHLRETSRYKRGQSLFGHCHAVGGYAEVFALEFAYDGFGPDGIDDACGIDDWKVDAYDTDASDDHQSESGGESQLGDDMDVAGDNEEDEPEPSDPRISWELPELDISDEPQSCKFTPTYRST